MVDERDDADEGGRPVIAVTAGDLHKQVDEGIKALRADPDVYVRGDALVHVTSTTQEDEHAGTRPDGTRTILAGTPKIHAMAPATLRVRLCRHARWEKPVRTRDGESWAACDPGRSIVEGIHAAKEWPGLRNLKGIIEAPSLRPDGSVLDVPGYDPVTGFLFAPSGAFRCVDPRATHDDARQGYATLAALFDDFPYAIRAGHSAAVAAVLTLLGRPAIEGPTPAIILDATTPGSGKTLQVDVFSGIATGREASRQHFPFSTGRDRDMELSKVLAMIARRGAPLVNFDNLDASSGAFGGSALEEVLTARDSYTFRLLGKTEGLTVPWRTVVFGSGNNVEWSRDMDRRVLVARLESPHEDPERRPAESYEHPELAGRLFEHVRAHRADLVHAGLTLLRAYFVADKPLPAGFQRWGSFEAWSETIAGALCWVDAPDPMLCRPSQQGDESPDKVQHRILAREWDAFCRASVQTGITAHTLLGALYPKDRGGPPDPKWETLRGAVEHFAPPRPGGVPDATALGKALRKLKGAPVRTGDGPLRRFGIDGESGGRARWKVEDMPGRTVEGEAAP